MPRWRTQRTRITNYRSSLAIRDLKESQHQVIDQLKALQEGVSSNRAEMKRLSDEVAALKTPQQISPPSGIRASTHWAETRNSITRIHKWCGPRSFACRSAFAAAAREQSPKWCHPNRQAWHQAL